MTRRSHLAALIAALISLPHLALAAQGVRTIETRPGVVTRLAVLVPEMPARGWLIMFPGGYGTSHFQERNGVIRLGSNFLVRTAPQFVQHGFAVAIVDAPSTSEAACRMRFGPPHSTRRMSRASSRRLPHKPWSPSISSGPAEAPYPSRISPPLFVTIA